MDIQKWKKRLDDNIVTREMIDKMYIKRKISVEDYLYITGLEETDLVQEEAQPSKLEQLEATVEALQKQLEDQSMMLTRLFANTLKEK